MDGILNWDAAIAAANFTVAVGLFLLAGVSFLYSGKASRDNKTDLRLMLLGAGIEASAWGTHRLYWGVARAIGDRFYDLLTAWWFFSILIYIVGLTGIVLILTPVWKWMFGKQWRWLPFGFLLAWWWFIYFGLIFNDIDPHSLGIDDWIEEQLSSGDK